MCVCVCLCVCVSIIACDEVNVGNADDFLKISNFKRFLAVAGKNGGWRVGPRCGGVEERGL